jgi:hypothetical protein
MKHIKTQQELNEGQENLNISDVRSSFSELAIEHKDLIKMASKKSNEIYKKLEDYYTSEKIKSFDSWDDFLEDINYMIETDSMAKPNFIKMVQKNYF